MKNLSILLLFLICSIASFGQTGNFWGATYNTYGGDGGRIYRFSADGTNPVLVKTYQQADIDGAEPFETPLFLASDGKLYGAARYGGFYQSGTLFKIDPVTFEFTKLYDFTFNPGGSGTPGVNGSLAEGADGFLYGYGDYGGYLFKIKKDGTGYVRLTSGRLNTNYESGLTLGSDNELYGVSKAFSSGVGAEVFRFSTSGTRATIATLPAGQSGVGTLIKASNGRLYGSAFHVQTFASIIFSCNNDGSDLQTVSIPDGLINRIVEGPGSKIYGTVSGLPSSKSGLFEIGLNGTGYSLIYQFESFHEAFGPMAIDGSTIYGTTRSEQVEDGNLIYKYVIGGSGYSVVSQISEDVGTNPVGVTLGPNGNLFVVNQSDNTPLGAGSIVKVKTDGTAFEDIKDLFIDNDGFVAGMRMTSLPMGEMLGVAAAGGDHTQGVIFKIDNDDQYQVLFSFDGDNGAIPIDAPVAGPNDFYYGTTNAGGANKLGVMYRIKANGSGYEKLFDFSHDTGSGPYGGLTLVNGRFYGITSEGGSGGAGTIFGIDPDGTDFAKLLEFDGDNGGYSFLTFLVYNNGFLYGTTPEGGADSRGVVFKIKPDGTGFKTLFELTDEIDFAGPSSVFLKADGDLLVVITRGGSHDRGGIFSVKADGTENELVHEFDTEWPDANTVTNGHLTLGPDGLIWGVEPNGGANGTGTVFKMNADGSNYTTIDLHLDSNPIGYMMPWYGLTYVPESEPAGETPQTITFPELTTKTLGTDEVFELNATSSSELPVVYSTTSDKINIIGKQVGIIKAGRATITAKQNGNDTYAAATPVDRSFCINPAKPEILIGGDEGSVLTSDNGTGNQWYLDGTLIPDATDNVYEAAIAGSYTVKTTIDDCVSEMSEAQVVTVTTVTGFEENTDKLIKLFPNPAATEVYLHTPSPADVTMIDVMGRVIDKRSTTLKEERFSVESLNRGVYYFRIKMNDKVVVRNFVKL